MTKKKEWQAKIVFMDPNKLTPYVNNAKIHSDEQIDKLAGMIAEFGFNAPILVDTNNIIVAGHGRREAAVRLNLEKVPVIVADHLDEHQIKAARIADNKVSSLEYDMEKLRFDIGTLERMNFDLNMTGLSVGELGDLLKVGELGSSAPDNINRTQEAYDESEIRQIVLIMDKAKYERILGDFSRLMQAFDVDTNMAVVERLISSYDSGGTDA